MISMMTHERGRWVTRAAVVVVVAVLVGVCAAAHVRAVTTRHFSLDSARVLSAGKLEGTAVHSDGSVRPGVETRRLALEGVGVARALLVRADGVAFVGTGNQGKIYKVDNDKATVFSETGELAVTSLVSGFGGALFAATIPHGKIFRVDAAGKTSVFAQPAGADHVWALAFDAKRATLFAATGPEGKLFSIDARGKSEVVLDTDASHVMALALDRDGTLYAGTDGEALLYKLRAPARAEVLYDFEGNEVTAIAVRDGVLAVAANLFPKPSLTPPKPKPDDKDDGKTTDKTDTDKATDRPKPGSGTLWRIDAGGRARKLFTPDEGHLTAVEWAQDGAIYTASGKSGAIHRVEADGTYASWVDVDERQVLALSLTGAHPMFSTGDGAAVYRVLAGKAREALWTSKVLDAEFASRWGGLSWRGDGKLSFQTRSGNTDKPEVGWSEWSSALTAPGPIRSPAGRFLQIRARLDTDKPAAIYAVTAYYAPQNQPVTLRELNVAPKKAALGGRPDRASGDARKSEAPTSVYTAEWEVSNPDGDDLRYRLSYRREGRGTWLPISKETEILTRTNYEWTTEGVPDGFYRVRVEASDELENPTAGVLKATLDSEPFLLDNHPPHVDKLAWAGGVLRGIATDSMGPVSSLERSVDGGDWVPFDCEDGIFDTDREPFALPLELPRGAHVVAVRATDARRNVDVAELEVNVK